MERLKKELLKDEKEQKAKNKKWVIETYKERKESESFKYMLQRNLTGLKFNKWVNGQITDKEAQKNALERMNKETEKRTAENIAKLERIEKAAEVKEIYVNIRWVKNATWGYNPTAEVLTIDANGETHTTEGKASGCGYDKESAAIAGALNSQDVILKALYAYKEKQLKKGKKDRSATACTGRDNRDIIAYGAGYSVLPYFEGGVGTSCFIRIFDLMGFKCIEQHTKTADSYVFIKRGVK